MAIKPIEQRLQSILPEQDTGVVEPPVTEQADPQFANIPDEDVAIEDTGTPNMEEEGTLVAGIGDAGLRGIIKKGSRKTTQQAVESPEKSIRPLAPDMKVGEDGIPEPVPAGKATLIPEAGEDVTTKVGEAVEARAVAEPTTFKPPEEAFNTTRMPDNIADIINGTSDALGIETKSVTFDEIKAKADQLGVDEKFLTRLLDSEGNMMPNAVDTYRAMNLMEASAGELDRLFKLVNSGQATDVDKLQLRQQISMHGLIQKSVKGIQTETARALAVMRVPRDGNVDLIRRTLDESGGDNSLQDLARAYVGLGDDTAAKNKLVEKSMFSSVKDVWFTTWINGILSSPVTHAKNILGNSMFGAYQVPERMIAAFYGNVLPDGVRSWKALVPGSAKEKVEFDEFLTDIQSFTSGIREGLSLASTAFKNNMPSDPLSKIELAGKRGGSADISAAAFGMSDDGLLAKGINFYGKAVTLPGRALMAEDEFFKGVFYRTEFNRLALRRGKSVYREALEAGDDEVTAIAKSQAEVTSIMKDPPADLDEAAMQAARRSTFTMDLPPALKSIEPAFQHPIVKMVAPFFRTPSNIALEVIERTPFAPISSRFRDDFMQGGAVRDLALAKMTMGSALLATFASMGGEGMITGRGPGRKADREALLREGWQPYSLVLPKDMFGGQVERLGSMGKVSVSDDKIYVSFNGLEPISAFMAMAADYAEYSRYEDDAGKVEEVFMGGLYGMYHYMSQQPFLQGISDLASALTGTIPNTNKAVESVVNGWTKTFGSFAVGGSPAGVYSSAVAGIERFLDPNSSDVSTAGLDLPMGVKGFYEGLKKYQSRVPGMSDNIPVRLNLWGDPVQVGQGNAYELVLPTRISPGQFSPVDNALVQMGSPIGMPNRKVDGVELNADQYNSLITIYGKEFGAKQQLEAVIASPGFSIMTLDAQQSKVRQVHDTLMEAARKTLVSRDTELQGKIRQLQEKKRSFGLFYKD
jgi:hypothetical protein